MADVSNSRTRTEATDSFRLIHGAADHHPGHYVEQLADWLLWQTENPDDAQMRATLEETAANRSLRGIYVKHLNRHVRGQHTKSVSPLLISGEAAPEPFLVRENGISFELAFNEGYSYGLFLDQRENRRRLLERKVTEEFPLRASGDVLNTFAYTCAFSVCAAKAGYTTTSLDLSRKYLDWGKRNFQHNGLDPNAHDFIYGDALEWFRRLNNKGRKFDVIILDPPTFSKSRRGVFRAEKDYTQLVAAALPLLRRDGVLLSSTNAARLDDGRFLAMIDAAFRETDRGISQEVATYQPPDFPDTDDEPAYLKAVWTRVG
ncbi:MAG: class I SAM-dependent rRNA methyltransferase [Limisphaerales bacterium]